LEYIFTLVRVDGMSGLRDPFLDLQDLLDSPIPVDGDGLRSRYCILSSAREPLEMLTNLLNCVAKQRYTPSPFRDLWRGGWPNAQAPRPDEVVSHVSARLGAADRREIAEMLDRGYPKGLLTRCSEGGECPLDELRAAHDACQDFLRSLLQNQRAERLTFLDRPRFHKLQDFTVMELLVDETVGLYGFRMHFSNGSDAVFSRTEKWTECRNVMPDIDGIEFQVGDLDALRQEWRVGDKRLYEIGLIGRYNTLGEWKPLIYPGDFHKLEEEARAFSDDPDVQGAFFYMLCTGHRVVEFVIRSNIDLPVENVGVGKNLHLFKCPVPDGGGGPKTHTRIYDGTLDVDRVEASHLRSLIADIGIVASRFAFAYGGIVDWRVKYPVTASVEGVATPSREDLDLLDAFFKRFPTSPEAVLLDAGLDWYNRGRSSRNPFTAFLCYYVAVESVANAVVEGDADLGLGYTRGTKAERAKEQLECIGLKHEEVYAADPVRFTKEAYFECVVSLRSRTERVLELVFGQGHEHIIALFRKKDGYSLSDIRSGIAHGALSLLDTEDEKLVRSRLGGMAHIAREFLTRVVFGLRPGEELPKWSGRHTVGFSFADPRSVLAATPKVKFATDDWRIRPEWCD
jgi:hypothetical protein